MNVISLIDRKISGFPMWTKGKEYEVLDKEFSEKSKVVKIKDDAGKIHWIAIYDNFTFK